MNKAKDKGKLPEDKPDRAKGIISRRALAERARELVEQYPDWSNKQVNAMLRLDYSGRYLMPKTLSKIRKGTEVYPAKYSTFHDDVVPGAAYRTLKKEGFSAYEAREFMKGLHIDINRPVVVAMRRTRIKWMNAQLRKGWTIRQVERAVNGYYTKPDRSPFDFLKREYRSKKRISGTAYKQALTKRHQQRLSPSEKRARQITSAFYNR